MTITSVAHPPTCIPLLQTVPFHSHVFIFPFSIISPLVPLTVRPLLNPRASSESLCELKAAAAAPGVVSSKLGRGIDPEDKSLTTP